MKTSQRGNTFIGLITGIVIGLGVALGIAVYVTKVPIPFVSKTQRNTAEQDEAEARRNRDWDPNAPLAGKAGAAKPPAVAAPGGSAASGSVAAAMPGTGAPVPVIVTRPKGPVPAVVSPDSEDPIGDLARARAGTGNNGGTAAVTAGPDPFIYFVQAGAYRSTEDAEAQRAKLSLMGVEAKVTEREQSGRQVFRVRIGPFEKKDEADKQKEKLDAGGVETALVRVQR